MPVVHAPANGVWVQGTFFSGGEFIPQEVLDRATPQEKAIVQATQNQPDITKPAGQQAKPGQAQGRQPNQPGQGKPGQSGQQGQQQPVKPLSPMDQQKTAAIHAVKEMMNMAGGVDTPALAEAKEKIKRLFERDVHDFVDSQLKRIKAEFSKAIEPKKDEENTATDTATDAGTTEKPAGLGAHTAPEDLKNWVPIANQGYKHIEDLVEHLKTLPKEKVKEYADATGGFAETNLSKPKMIEKLQTRLNEFQASQDRTNFGTLKGESKKEPNGTPAEVHARRENMHRTSFGDKKAIGESGFDTSKRKAHEDDLYSQHAEDGTRPNVLGDAGKVPFHDPVLQKSDADILKLRSSSKPIKMPNNDGSAEVMAIQKTWDEVSRIWPEGASMVKSIRTLTDSEFKQFGVRAPVAAVNPKTGELVLRPGTTDLDPEILWHELVHLEQAERGDFYKNPYRTEQGITEHGRLMESEAHQRGNMQAGNYFSMLSKTKTEPTGTPAEVLSSAIKSKYARGPWAVIHVEKDEPTPKSEPIIDIEAKVQEAVLKFAKSKEEPWAEKSTILEPERDAKGNIVAIAEHVPAKKRYVKKIEMDERGLVKKIISEKDGKVVTQTVERHPNGMYARSVVEESEA